MVLFILKNLLFILKNLLFITKKNLLTPKKFLKQKKKKKTFKKKKIFIITNNPNYKTNQQISETPHSLLPLTKTLHQDLTDFHN